MLGNALQFGTIEKAGPRATSGISVGRGSGREKEKLSFAIVLTRTVAWNMLQLVVQLGSH